MQKILLVFVLFLAGCSWQVLSPYKVDVQQGNYVDQEMVAKLKPGMTKSQVRFALGSPLIADAFHQDRWDYVFRQQKGGAVPEQRLVTAVFDGDRLVRLEGNVFISPEFKDPGAAIAQIERDKQLTEVPGARAPGAFAPPAMALPASPPPTNLGPPPAQPGPSLAAPPTQSAPPAQTAPKAPPQTLGFTPPSAGGATTPRVVQPTSPIPAAAAGAAVGGATAAATAASDSPNTDAKPATASSNKTKKEAQKEAARGQGCADYRRDASSRATNSGGKLHRLHQEGSWVRLEDAAATAAGRCPRHAQYACRSAEHDCRGAEHGCRSASHRACTEKRSRERCGRATLVLARVGQCCPSCVGKRRLRSATCREPVPQRDRRRGRSGRGNGPRCYRGNRIIAASGRGQAESGAQGSAATAILVGRGRRFPQVGDWDGRGLCATCSSGTGRCGSRRRGDRRRRREGRQWQFIRRHAERDHALGEEGFRRR